jgi:glycerophosphoryl diester phosphodiesterase
MLDKLQDVLMLLVDWLFAWRPAKRPARDNLRRCRLVSHRGEHNNSSLFENTLEAFRAAHSAGVWGVELDIRWTRDGVPVVSHDADASRVFSQDVTFSQLDAAELHKRLPLIPTLEDVVREFGGNVHLMLELKDSDADKITARSSCLQTLLANLEPGSDYHFLALNPALFEQVTFVPPQALLPVAVTEVTEWSRQTMAHGWAGVSGHYALLGGGVIEKMHDGGFAVGTGFSNSRAVLYRELNRGVDWIFSNEAVAMQAEINRALNDSESEQE